MSRMWTAGPGRNHWRYHCVPSSQWRSPHFDWVIQCLMDAMQCTQSNQASCLHHFNGKATVETGFLDLLEAMKTPLDEGPYVVMRNVAVKPQGRRRPIGASYHINVIPHPRILLYDNRDGTMPHPLTADDQGFCVARFMDDARLSLTALPVWHLPLGQYWKYRGFLLFL